MIHPQSYFFHGDCMEITPDITAKSIDLILCDLPYSQTACGWDKEIINPASLWVAWKQILKPGGTVILTTSGKFTMIMGASNLPWFKYEIIWRKAQATNSMQIRTRPGKAHENILVFCDGVPYYNPQMRQGKPYSGFSSSSGSEIGEAYGGGQSRHRDNPKGILYPTSVIDFPRDRTGPKHPTKKPLALFEYLIRTFSKPGDVVFDPTAGVGTTAMAAINTGRNYVCIEKNYEYFKKGLDWINEKVSSSKIENKDGLSTPEGMLV